MRYKDLLLSTIVFLCFFSGRTQTPPAIPLTIHFDYGRADIWPADSISISGFLDTLRQSFRIVAVELTGYCDSIGGDRYNDRLSRERVESVMQYLRQKGLGKTPIRSQAYGRRRSLNDNADEEKRALNRRVIIAFRIRPHASQEPVAEKTAAAPTEKPVAAPVDTAGHPKKPAPATLTEAFRDTAIRKGSNLILKNLNFYPGRHQPVPASIPVLDELVGILRNNPNLRIEIQGYVCCVAEFGDGIDAETGTSNLSLQRARYVYMYLRLQGIDESRLAYKGLGGQHKLYPEEKDENEKGMNRRVELHVLSL